jgi:hypothetical protein
MIFLKGSIVIGPFFESAIITGLCNITGMSKSRTISSHPQGNGVSERFSRTILNMLGTLDPEKKKNWKSHINLLVHGYNCTKHNSTQYTRYFLMFGRHDKNTPDYIQNLKHRLKEAYELAAIG